MNWNPVIPDDVLTQEKKIVAIVTGSLILFLFAATVLGLYWLFLFPCGILLLYFLVTDLTKVFFLILLFLPLSMPIAIPGATLSLLMPTEPLIIALLLFWGAEIVMGVRGEPTTLRSIKRVDLFLGFFLVTLTVSTLASLFPLFSLKMLMNMYWYVTASYVFVKSRMSSQKQMNRMLAALMVIAGLASLYSLSRHAIVGFSRTSIPWAIEPFFKEHGSYSAFLSISFGISFSLAFGRGMPKGLRKIALWVTPLLVFGILFSFARGAWLGVFVYVLFFVLVHSREILKPGSFIVLLFFLTISTLAVVGFGIQSSLETNLESIGDVERNVSNLERFNRWVAAANMVEKFPFTGVGFGAYPDSYGRFRDRRFETPVSDFYGYPHNDYIQFLAEAGVFALLFWLCFLGTLFSAGLIGYFRIRDELDRRALVGCLGGILTYLVHAVFNDFLMVDKVAVPFWVCAAIVVAILGRNAEHVLGSSNTRSPETTRVSI